MERRRATPGVVVCGSCGAYIGHYVERRNAKRGRWETWLSLGGAVVDNAHGVCGACGAEWHWSASSRRLARLIGLVGREDAEALLERLQGLRQEMGFAEEASCRDCEQRWYGECEGCELRPGEKGSGPV